MSGYKAAFFLGVQPTGYLALTGWDGKVKKRVLDPNNATEFISGNEAVIQASTELEGGERVVWVRD